MSPVIEIRTCWFLFNLKLVLYQIRETYYYSVVNGIMEHLSKELNDNNDSVEKETGARFDTN
jgi:hypothetical protein